PGFNPGSLVETLCRGGLELARQAELLRDVVRGPFRRLLFRAGWRFYHDAAGARIARTIYDDRGFDLLPVLADALEDAGCAAPELLGHWRGPGRDVRGWWVVDLLLGKS